MNSYFIVRLKKKDSNKKNERSKITLDDSPINFRTHTRKT